MKIGDEVYIHGYVDEIRQNVVIIRNDGGYFGTVAEEITSRSEKPNTCGDAISRQAVLDITWEEPSYIDPLNVLTEIRDKFKDLPSVTPQPKTGHWLRMSDLSEQEDDRYRCSRCGNVVHHTNKMNLYTFNSWCGRCGSDNGRHIDYAVEANYFEEPQESDHKCHTCKHYTSGEHDGSCGSYICKEYSNWESEDKDGNNI